MTREEQIIEKAKEYYDAPNLQMRVGFIEGAKWADANPQFSKEEFVEKACEWLKENVNKYSYVMEVEGTKYMKVHFTDSLIEDFKKAMKE
jgi:hypothetical protein